MTDAKPKRKSLADVRESIMRCKIKNPPFPITMTVHGGDYMGVLGSGVLVMFDATVKDRDSGHDIHLKCGRTFYTTESDAYIVREIESVVKEIFMHEFSECWHLDGFRVHDPHATHAVVNVAHTATVMTFTMNRFAGMVATDEEKP